MIEKWLDLGGERVGREPALVWKDPTANWLSAGVGDSEAMTRRRTRVMVSL